MCDKGKNAVRLVLQSRRSGCDLCFYVAPLAQCFSVFSTVFQVHTVHQDQAGVHVLQEANEESQRALPSRTLHHSAHGDQWYAAAEALSYLHICNYYGEMLREGLVSLTETYSTTVTIVTIVTDYTIHASKSSLWCILQDYLMIVLLSVT